MLRIPVLPKALCSLAFFCLLAQNSFSQGSRPFRFSDEIGVDVAPMLRGEPGISLLYKHGLGKKEGLDRQMRFSLRLLLGYYEQSYDYSNFLRRATDTIFFLEGAGDAKHRFIAIGTEVQMRKKNFRFHIGADAGYRHGTSIGESKELNRIGNMSVVTRQFEHEDKYDVAQASVLAGINYFFLRRFSIGLEANVSAALEFSNSRTFENGALLRTDHGTQCAVDIRLRRLLTLSYHFGGAVRE